MIFGAARHRRPFIDKEDCQNAIDILHDAESRMTEIFDDMKDNDEHEVIQEVFQMVLREYNKAGKKPVSVSAVYNFMQQKVPTWKVDYILKSMIRSGNLRMQGQQVTPGRI